MKLITLVFSAVFAMNAQAALVCELFSTDVDGNYERTEFNPAPSNKRSGPKVYIAKTSVTTARLKITRTGNNTAIYEASLTLPSGIQVSRSGPLHEFPYNTPFTLVENVNPKTQTELAILCERIKNSNN